MNTSHEAEDLVSPFLESHTPVLYTWDLHYREHFETHQYQIEALEKKIAEKAGLFFMLFGDRYLLRKQIELEILKKEQVLGNLWNEELGHYNKEFDKEVDPNCKVFFPIMFPYRGVLMSLGTIGLLGAMKFRFVTIGVLAVQPV
jgi:hypothetical protein